MLHVVGLVAFVVAGVIVAVLFIFIGLCRRDERDRLRRSNRDQLF